MNHQLKVYLTHFFQLIKVIRQKKSEDATKLVEIIPQAS